MAALKIEPRVGDTVLLTQSNGVTVKGPITGLSRQALTLGNGAYESTAVPTDCIVTVEILERAKRPLPTKPGIYVSAGADALHMARLFRLDALGHWSEPDAPISESRALAIVKTIHREFGLIRLAKETEQ
jgi:hypothetical protein